MQTTGKLDRSTPVVLGTLRFLVSRALVPGIPALGLRALRRGALGIVIAAAVMAATLTQCEPVAARADARGPGGGGTTVPRFVFSEIVAQPDQPRRARDDSGRGRRPVTAQADPGLTVGDWLYFDPEPATLSAGDNYALRARKFTLLGDFPHIELQLYPTTPVRRFDRISSGTIDGDTVSVFNLVFPKEDVQNGHPPDPIRFDRTLFPRLRPARLPKAKVVRIDDRVQYSSHVVNIVYPWDGAGMQGFPWSQISEIFYQYFSDTYEELAFTPARQYQSPQWGAMHATVHSEVEGIGLEKVDRRADWGGPENLLSALLFIRGDIAWNYLSLHEMAHQWGFFFDLFEVMGREPGGTGECSISNHPPLLGDDQSFLSYCLMSPMHLEAKGGKRVAVTDPAPVFHPLQLYAMGLLPKDLVAPVYLRDSQSRPRNLRQGAKVSGPYTKVTIDDIVAHYGERGGPVAPPVWRRANIVVSPERLLRKKDLQYYNFLARRLSDPGLTGVADVDGIPSVEFAAEGRMDLQTEIRPLSGSRVRGSFAVSYPTLGKKDIRGLVLDRKLGTRFRPGKAVTVSGRVVSPRGYDQIELWLGETAFRSRLTADGRFVVVVKPTAEDRGPKWLRIWLGERKRMLGRVAAVYVE